MYHVFGCILRYIRYSQKSSSVNEYGFLIISEDALIRLQSIHFPLYLFNHWHPVIPSNHGGIPSNCFSSYQGYLSHSKICLHPWLVKIIQNITLVFILKNIWSLITAWILLIYKHHYSLHSSNLKIYFFFSLWLRSLMWRSGKPGFFQACFRLSHTTWNNQSQSLNCKTLWWNYFRMYKKNLQCTAIITSIEYIPDSRTFQTVKEKNE